MPTHRVNCLEIEIAVDDEALGQALMDRISGLRERRMAPMLDRVFGELSPPGRLDAIERLELDLGVLSEERFDEELVERLEVALRRALAQRLRAAAPNRSPTELLRVYALCGALPWWAERGDSRQVGEALRQALRGAELPGLLRSLGDDPAALRRLAAACEVSALIEVAESVWPGRGEGVGRLEARLNPAGRSVLRALIGGALFAAVAAGESAEDLISLLISTLHISHPELAERLRADPERRHPAPRGPMQNEAGEGSGAGEVGEGSAPGSRRQPRRTPLRRRPEVGAGVRSGTQRLNFVSGRAPAAGSAGTGRLVRFAAGQAALKPRRSGVTEPRGPGRSAAETPPGRLPTVAEAASPGPVEPPPFARSPGLAEPPPPDSAPSPGLHGAPAQWLTQPLPPVGALSPRVEAPHPTTASPVERAAPVEDQKVQPSLQPSVLAPVHPDTSPRRPATPRYLAERRRKALAALEQLFIDDAGLVLLWPFLERFFSRLELTDAEHGFLDEGCRAQAVALLSLLVHGEPEPPEWRLVLPKILCGLSPEEPVALEQPLSEAQIEEAERLLQAVIAHATILGDMPIDGLRGSFLRREGVLSTRGGAWLLQVERAPYDLVLDRFPWSWSWIRLPWMPDSLQVEW